MTRRKRTVLGAGQVGTKLARLLGDRGFDVTLVRRSAAGPEIPGVIWMQGDIIDDTFIDAACRGADVVFNCTNPPDYTDWSALMPLYRSGWRAAARAQARFVQLDSLYGYGAPEDSPFDESTPMNPRRAKGDIRKQVNDELLSMHAAGRIEATIGRASDYFGPQTPSSVVFRPDVYDRIVAGKTLFVTGDPDTPHGYSYTPDVASGLATLADHDGAFGRAWHLPMTWTGSTRALLLEFARACGTSPAIRRVPHWALKTVGMVSPMVGALAEMNYQWDIAYVMDDRAFREAFGGQPTPVADAVRETLRDHATSRAA